MLGSVFAAPMALAYHVVVAIAAFLAPLPGGLATAAAIVVFTIAVRLLLSPLSFAALRGQAAMAGLAPRVTALKQRYARQPERLQAELTALYRAEGGGMLAGCLPLLLQLPFFSLMYRLFLSATVDGKPNGLLARHLLAAPLGSHWLSGAGPASTQGLVFLGLFAVLAVVGWVAGRVAQRTLTSATTDAAPATMAGTESRLTGMLGRVMPYATLVIAAFVPLAAGLYLLTTTAWTAAERLLWARLLSRRDNPNPPQLPTGGTTPRTPGRA